MATLPSILPKAKPVGLFCLSLKIATHRCYNLGKKEKSTLSQCKIQDFITYVKVNIFTPFLDFRKTRNILCKHDKEGISIPPVALFSNFLITTVFNHVILWINCRHDSINCSSSAILKAPPPEQCMRPAETPSSYSGAGRLVDRKTPRFGSQPSSD